MAAAAAVIVLLYLLNRFVFLPRVGGWVRMVLSGYWADVLAGALMVLLLCGGLLVLRRPPPSPLAATVFLLLCGLFWEGITPLYLPRSVGDPLDLLAYWLGGMALLPWVRHLLLQRRN